VHHTDPRYHAQSTVRSNARIEALNSKIRLISHRAYGFHSATALIAMVYLCCAGIQITLPHR
jgi:transposase